MLESNGTAKRTWFSNMIQSKDSNSSSVHGTKQRITQQRTFQTNLVISWRCQHTENWSQLCSYLKHVIHFNSQHAYLDLDPEKWGKPDVSVILLMWILSSYRSCLFSYPTQANLHNSMTKWSENKELLVNCLSRKNYNRKGLDFNLFEMNLIDLKTIKIIWNCYGHN